MAFLGVEGVSGEVRVGGRVAARLGAWSATRDKAADAWQIGAALAEVNDLWLDGPGPFELRLHIGRSVWRWRGVDLQRDGGSVSITAYRRYEHLAA